MKLKTFIRQAKRKINYNLLYSIIFSLIIIIHSFLELKFLSWEYFLSSIIWNPIWREIILWWVIYYFWYKFIKDVEWYKEKYEINKFSSILSNFFLLFLWILALQSIFWQSIFWFDLSSYEYWKKALEIIKLIQYPIVILAIVFGSLIFYINIHLNIRNNNIFNFLSNLLNKIITIFKNILTKNILYSLIIIILLHILLKLFIQNYTWISVESDLVFYDAKLFLEWLIPYKDFLTREPYLIYITSFFLLITKDLPIDIFLNFYLLFSIWTIITLYKIWTLISDKKLWLLLAFLYSFAPFLIKFPSSNYQFYGVIYLFFISITIYFLLKSIKIKKYIDFFLVGIFMWITIWVYRWAMPFLPLLPFLTTFLLSKEKFLLKDIVKINLIIYLWLSLSLLPPILYYSSIIWFKWFNIVLSSKPLILLYVIYIPIILITYIYYKKILKNKLIQNIIFIIICLFLTLMFFFINTDNISLLNKIWTINDYIRHLWYFLLPTLLIWLTIFIEYLFPKIIFKDKIIYISNIIIFLLILYWVNHTLRWTSFELSSNLIFLFSGIFILYWIVHIYYLQKNNASNNKDIIFILFMFIFIFTFSNLLFVEWLENYVLNYIIPSIIIFWIFLYSSNINKNYILLILFLNLFTISYYLNNNIIKGSDITKETLNQVIKYIKDNTNKNEKIFTTNPTFIFRSDRKLVLNITHPMVYWTNPPSFSNYDPYNIVPSINDIINTLENNKIQYIIAWRRTKSLFLTNRHPNIKDYILKNYIKVEVISNIDIYKRKNTTLDLSR